MTKEILNQSEEKMKKTIESMAKEYSAIRTGRASPALLDRVRVEAYGQEMHINQLATITVPEPRLIIIKPFDKSTFQSIEKAIMKSDLGLMPSASGDVIRLPIPPLNEERRKELVKLVKKEAEEKKVALRNNRRDAKEHIEKLQKEKKITEDEQERALAELQKITDKYTLEIGKLEAAKEKEVMEV